MPSACADHRQQHQLLGHEIQPLKNTPRRLKLSVNLCDELVDGENEKQQNETNGEMLDHGGEGKVDDYSFDELRMYEFKIRRCVRSRSHDWTDCPFAHPGEKARRRDPRRYHYSGTPCPDYRRTGGDCPRGDACEYAHGVFELWLHPARYRTIPCKDGRRCRRKVCFFAHTPAQLRIVHPSSTSPPTSCYSPTSILMGLSAMTPLPSPSVSPPTKSSPVRGIAAGSTYTELLSSLEAMQVNRAAASEVDENAGGGAGPDLGWVEELLE